MNDIAPWLSLIREKSNLEDVGKDFLTSLIHKIEIGERAVVNDVKYQDIKIFYKYVGFL